jgi:hypothetical protein
LGLTLVGHVEGVLVLIVFIFVLAGLMAVGHFLQELRLPAGSETKTVQRPKIVVVQMPELPPREVPPPAREGPPSPLYPRDRVDWV